MKYVFLTITLICFTIATFAQNMENAPVKPQVNYLKRSKTQRSFAKILLYGGITGLGLGLLSYAGSGENVKATENFINVCTIAVIGSIPLFIAAHHSKKKAMNATGSLEMGKFPAFVGANGHGDFYPAIAVKVRL